MNFSTSDIGVMSVKERNNYGIWYTVRGLQEVSRFQCSTDADDIKGGSFD